MNEGGYHAIPKLTFPGGMLAGCSAGFLNVAKIKGSHNAMKTGMLAAEAIFENYKKNDGQVTGDELVDYETSVRNSWVAEELKVTRNFKSGFDKGLWAGLAHGGLISHITKGREPWTLSHKTRDAETTKPASEFKEI